MTDPTPRTAATARERDIYETVREVIRDYTYLPFGLGEAKEMCSRITSALAAAEAPGRVAALEAALRRIADLDPDLDAEAEAAALASAKRIASNALAAPAPTPSEPVGRLAVPVLCNLAGHPSRLHHHDRDGKVRMVPTPATRDE